MRHCGPQQVGPNRTRLGRNQGFSLLEVMVAISVLSVVVLAISLVPALGLGRNNDARTYAVNVARELLDSYRSLLLDHRLWTDPKNPVENLRPSPPQNLRFGCTLQIPAPVKYSIDLDNPPSMLRVTFGPAKVLQVRVVIDCPQAGQTSLSTYVGDPSPAGS
jgi:prepilin-type N-terminal cleavage/methylation domain-containing protein